MNQASLVFPQSLAEKYRPLRIAEFIGLQKERKILSRLVAQPYASAWLFCGASGTGKTSLALAIATELGAEVHHIGSQQCNLATLETVVRYCQFVPLSGGFHLVLVDESDLMSDAGQNYLLSKLDASEPVPNTIWIFTANDTARLHPRFLSRCKVLEFSSYGLNGQLIELLRRIWASEANGAPEPNFAAMTKGIGGNCREALQRLEIEVLSL